LRGSAEAAQALVKEVNTRQAAQGLGNSIKELAIGRWAD